jgi:hypothetical protein
MIRKIVGISLIALTFISLGGSAHAADKPKSEPKVILDQLLTGPVPALNAKDLNIPSDLTPGEHEITVEVYDDNGVVSSQTALFCKDNAGELHFDNICPDLIAKPKAKKPKAFNPYEDPESTISFLAVALAIASLLVGSRRKNDDTPPDLGGADAAVHAFRKGKRSWGDRRWYINTNFMTSLDQVPRSMAKVFDKFSFLLARIAIDARYLRAIFGNLSWLTVPAAIYFSYVGARSIHNEALPFDRNITLILILIGIFDAFAGLFVAFIYLDFVFASGNLNSQESIFFALGYALLFFAPGLLASKFRPLHRSIKDFPRFWERATDYVLGTLLTGWAASKLVAALPGLIGHELSIAKHAHEFGLIVGAALAARLLLEEIAWYLFSNRSMKLSVELKPRGLVQKVRAIIFKVSLMILLALPYIGWNRYLAAGVSIFLLPQLLGLIDAYLPNWSWLAQISPRGVFKAVILGTIGIIVGSQIVNMHPDFSAKELLLYSFVVMPIPAFVYGIFDSLSGEPIISIKDHKYRYVYRISGILVLIVLILFVLGLNPITEIHGAWKHPGETWDSLTYKWWPQVQNTWDDFTNWVSELRK